MAILTNSQETLKEREDALAPYSNPITPVARDPEKGFFATAISPITGVANVIRDVPEAVDFQTSKVANFGLQMANRLGLVDTQPLESFDKMKWFDEHYEGREGELLSDYWDNVNSYEEAVFFNSVVEAGDRYESVKDDNNLLQDMVLDIATDPVALGLAVSSSGAYTALKSTTSRIALAGAEAGVYESYQQYADPMRTAEESAMVVGGATAIVGALGAAPVLLAAAKRVKKTPDHLGSDVLKEAVDLNKTVKYGDYRGAGAASTRKPTLKEMEFYVGDSTYKNMLMSKVKDAPEGSFAKTTLEPIVKAMPEMKMLKNPLSKLSSVLSPRERFHQIGGAINKRFVGNVQTPKSPLQGELDNAVFSEAVDDIQANMVWHHYNYNIKPIDDMYKKLASDEMKRAGSTRFKRTISMSDNTRAVREDVVVLQARYEGVYSDAQLIAHRDSLSDEYKKGLIDIVLARRKYYDSLNKADASIGMAGVKTRQGYAGPLVIDPVKIKNSDDYLRAERIIADDLRQFYGPKYGAMKNKAKMLDDLLDDHWNAVVEYEGIGDDIGLLAAKIEGGGYSDDVVNREVKRIAKEGREAEVKLKKAREEYRKVRDEVNSVYGDIENFEDMISKLPAKILSNYENGNAAYAAFGGRTVSGTVPWYYKSRIFDAKKFAGGNGQKNLLLSDSVRLDTRYIQTRSLKHALYRKFNDTDPDKILAKHNDEVYGQVRDLTKIAQDLRTGDRSSFEKFLVGGDQDIAEVLQMTGDSVDDITKAIRSIEKGRSDAEKFYTGMIKRWEGSYFKETYSRIHPAAAATLRVADAMTSMASLGFQVVPMLNEVVAGVYSHGFKAIKPMFKSYQKLASKEIRKFNKKQLKEARAFINYNNNAMIGDMGFTHGDIGEASMKLTRQTERGLKYFHLMNGSVHLDLTVRRAMDMFNEGSIAELIEKAATGAKMTNRERISLSKLGISKDDYKFFYDYIKKNKVNVDDFEMIDVLNMPPEMRSKWDTAILRANEDVLLQAREGDIGHFNSHPFIRMLLKFKQWPQMATQRYLVQGLQYHDAVTWQAYGFMAMLGMVKNEIRDAIDGRGYAGEDIDDKIYAGISEAGYMGIFHDIGLDSMANMMGMHGKGGIFADGRGGVVEDIAGVNYRIFKAFDELSGVARAAVTDEKDISDAVSSMYYLQRMLPGNQYVRSIISAFKDEDD